MRERETWKVLVNFQRFLVGIEKRLSFEAVKRKKTSGNDATHFHGCFLFFIEHYLNNKRLIVFFLFFFSLIIFFPFLTGNGGNNIM
jgi:hypothetical protein